MARTNGKWSTPNVPHKGWSCVNVEDLEAPDAVCEMCETQEIRYVHYMEHPDYRNILGVGCVCAEYMEQDYKGPRRRESLLRNSAQRKRGWLSREWRTSQKGNSYIRTDGFNITIFLNRNGTWTWCLADLQTDRKEYSSGAFSTENEAKLGAFDRMISLKRPPDWGL